MSECGSPRSSVKRRNLFAALVFALVCLLCTGCLKSPSSSKGKYSEGSSHPASYYEGYWLCSGYERDGKQVSFDEVTPEEKSTFPFLVLEISKNGGMLSQVSTGDEPYRMLFGGDARATGNGIRLSNEKDDLDFVSHDDALVLTSDAASSLDGFLQSTGLYPGFHLPQGDATYFFTRTAADSELKVSTFEFDGITLDVPTELAYVLNAASPKSGNNGGLFTYGISARRYGPEMRFSSIPSSADNIVEVVAESEGQDYAIEHASEFTEYRGTYYYLQQNEDPNYSRLEFVSNGKLYEIAFDYEDEDNVDYSDYRKHFFTSIRFAGEEPAGRQTGVPSGATSWQEAAQHVGETITVYGPVAGTGYSSNSNGQPTFIDLGAAYPDQNRVTIVIWGEDRGAFPEAPEKMYAGKSLCVTGEVYTHGGTCNIKVQSPAQVQIIDN